MRMRKKPNLVPRMERCEAVQIKDPEALRGKWRESFGKSELRLEIGCGKGSFTAATAEEAPDVLLVAIERVEDALVTAMERCMAAKLDNVRFVSDDALRLREFFAPDEVGMIYINFCDPWPKSRDAKHRLTSPNFLRIYADVLPVGGEIHFKTDNLPLFDWSEDIMRSEGWVIKDLTRNLPLGGVGGAPTDYETKFRAQGVRINYLTAVRAENTKSGADGIPPRMRDAALADARGANK